MFYQRNWSKWQHVMFIEDFRAGVKNYELLFRVCSKSGLTQYKKIYVGQCVHGFVEKLNSWFNKKNQ